MEEIFLDELDMFKPGILATMADHKGGPPLAKSIAISEYFKRLSLSIAQVIPSLLVKHVSSQSSDEERVKELHSLMSDVICIIDAESLLSFFKKYFQNIMSAVKSLPSVLSQKYKALAEYTAKELSSDLSLATHLDVNDLVIIFKKRVLTECAKLAQISKNELALENEFINFLKTKLSGYEWVCKLTLMQNDISEYLRIGQERSLNDSEKVSLAQLMGIHSLSDNNVKAALKLLEYHGVVQHTKKDLSNHAIIVFAAANLSLGDIIQHNCVLSKFREVQFLCTECFYLDASLCYGKGKGKGKVNNVAIVASKVIVVRDKLGKREIDVSGADGISYDASVCARDESLPGAHGNNGRHGEPGESGGNILICADEIENSELLILHSEGGCGGSGQHGGNGQDGKAIPSESDDLRRFGGYEKLTLIDTLKVNFFTGSFREYNESEIEGSRFNSAYGKSSHGVKVLYGRAGLDTYAFLYSRGVNGVSADGGNAGRGGKAGCGGSAGYIEIFRKNGIDRNRCHNVCVSSHNGSDGNAGKPGKPGKKDITESRKDYLVVDGFWKKVLRYDGFIDARPYTGKDRSRLDRGWYYCEPSVAKRFDSNMTDGYIEFFKVKRNTVCPTKYHKQAADGKENEQEEEVIHSTPSKPINRTEIQMAYQMFSHEHLQVQDISSLIQLLEEMQQNLHEKLQELETTHVRQHYKQIRRLGESSDLKLVHFDGDAQSISRLTIKDCEGTDINFVFEKITNIIVTLTGRPLFGTEDSVLQKYSILTTFIEDQLVEQFKNKEKKRLPEEDKCEFIYKLMEIVFHSTFLIHIDCKKPLQLQSILAIFHSAEELTAPFKSNHFHGRMMLMKQNIKPRYEWEILCEAHQKLLDISSYTENDLQRYAVAIYLKIRSQTSIEEIDKEFAYCFGDPDQRYTLKVSPFTRPLQNFEISCSAVLPLSSETKSALEMLMVFINEANENSHGNFHFPDILGAVEREFEAYGRTISDPDLMFIMTYIQDKLDQLLLYRTQLEDIFCEKILSKQQDELCSYKGGFIFYEEKSYQIIDFDFLQREHIIIKVKSKRNHRIKINLQNLRVTLDSKPVNFPKALLISKLDIESIESLWKKIEETFIKSNLPGELESFCNTLNFPQDDCAHKLTELLTQARSAQDIQFDLFAFHPPSHWMEKLFLSTAKKQYGVLDPTFVTEIEKRIDGLSHCYDKSLYCTLYAQFLQETTPEVVTFKVDILETLERMHFIFIEQNLSSLVTERGLAQSGIEDADYIICDLIDLEIIDSAGVFLPSTTEHTINLYCNSHELDMFFLRSVFFLQKNLRQLSGKELSFWNHKLGELRLRLSLQQLTGGNIDACDNLLVHIYQMQRHYGELEVLNFLKLICSESQRDVSYDELLKLLSKCSSKEWNFSIVIQIMEQRCIEQDKSSGHPSPLFEALEGFDWESHRNKERKVKEIVDLIMSQHRPYKDAEHLNVVLEAITDKVSRIKVKERSTSQLVDEQLKEQMFSIHIRRYSKCHIAQWSLKFKMVASTKRSWQIIEAFAVIRRGITLFYETEKSTTGVVPRDMQMIASLLFFQNLSAHGTKLLQQISTGEGKTMILCMAAIYKVLLGEKVDIVTSSSVLATRDAVDLKPLYDMFNVAVSHCCHEELSKRRKAYEADVIYGDVGSFQRDILETDFYDRKIRTDRTCTNVFVDEVDSMLVDKGQNMLYLSHALPDMNCLDQVYLEIWSLVNAKGFLGMEQEQKQLYFALKHKLLGAITPNAFTAISGVSKEKSQKYFENLVKTRTINSDDYCLTTTCFASLKVNVETFISDKHMRNEVLMVIQVYIEAKPLIQRFPKTMHSFINKSLRSWIHSAVCAKYFRPNKEYIIDIDHRESASDRYPKIVIMDNETGVEQESSQWGNGLHQFLQLKHNLRLSTESLKSVYMSNISFFKRYRSIMGVTGTMGSVEEHTLFKKLYGEILIVKVPTNKPSRMIIELPLCCHKKVEWEEAVYSDVREKLKNNRVVLLICEDVERARYLQQSLQSKERDMKQLLYLSSHQEKLEEKARFEPGQLIIATNLAGRGTDIKLMSEVKQNGGLHVCLSYLPPNLRVELQAYGRCARSGDLGSCRMIFYNKEGDLNYAIRKRNVFEAHRVSEIEADYFHNIKFQETLFYEFMTLYNTIKAKNSEPEHRAILDYCLDCWAFFLDHYTNAIESIPKKSSYEANREKDRILQAFHNEVGRVIEGLKEFEIDKLSLTPSRLLQLGHAFMKQELKRGNEFKGAGNKTNIELAVQLYRKATAVSADPFAHYYLAAAELNLSLHKRKVERRPLKQVFYEIMPIFHCKIRQCHAQVTMLQLANRYQDQTATGNAQYFHEQKQHEIEIYHVFISSMQDVIGKNLTHSVFDHTDWGEEGARVVFRIVHKEFFLKNPRIAKNYCRRLENLLCFNDSYFTYEAKIRDRVKSLIGKTVHRDDFVGVLPDKEELWSLLKKSNLITRETREPVPEDAGAEGIAQREELIGYWNPEIDIDSVQLEAWDCLDAHSFDWIKGIEEVYTLRIFSLLKSGHILNSNGQLMNLNLAKPLEILLPDSYVQYYKAVKDTLWHHTIYRFILDHLRGSAEIDEENDVSDYTPSTNATTHKSVVDILISLNRAANESSEGKVKHILAPVSKPKERISGAAAFSEDDPAHFRDHVPSEALNDKFLQQLIDNDMIATQVSGCGLNCMINAMMQHAKQDYLTSDFTEAKAVRTSLKQNHPDLDLSGMLHCDDEIASEVLTCVNDMCCCKLRMVSVFIASGDGPILYGGTSDKRFPSGKHVVLWQQGNHFVAVVHLHEFEESRYEVESEYPVNFEKEVPKIKKSQLKRLEKLKIVSKTNHKGKYRFCKPVEQIKSTLEAELHSPEERDSIIKFLTFKLEVDFKTLCNSPRVLASGQSHVLYDDLCLYAVVKEFKMKRTNNEIDKKLSELRMEDPYWYKDAAYWVTGKIPFYLNMTVLNQYLKSKNANKLTLEEFKELKTFLCTRSTIDHVLSCTREGNLRLAVTVIHSGSISFAQIPEVTNFVLLMLQLRSNASFITSTLKNLQSTLMELESPEVSLRRLYDLFENSVQEKGDILEWFSNNQCDLIINLAEQKWSWKSITTALSVIAIGVAQIAVGAVLLVATAGSASFLCNALISEGVSDMIFGIQGLVRGHCNWSQYFDHKILSITITIATAGIGAYLGRGVQASRYAYKAFGNASMALAESTVKQTGKSLGKVMAKQVGKKIVKKVVGAAVDAGINLACDKIVEEMSQSIENLSQCIIDSFDTMTEDEDLKQESTEFLKRQDPDKAEQYLHQIFTRVMLRKTFLEIWDDVESKLQTGTDVVTQAHKNASKHLQMVNKNIKGTRLVKGIGYASRFAPLISESVKIGLVKKKMGLLKEQLIRELRQHPATNQYKEPLDMTSCIEILKKELKEMKMYLSQETSQRGRILVTTCLQIVGQELKKHAITRGKEVWTHKIKGHMDMRKLMRYERKASEAKSVENPSIVVKYEGKLKKLMSRTRNPKVFAHLIEHHNVQLGPAFAIPALEKIIGRPIRLVNKEGEPLLNVHKQHVTGEPLVLTFTAGEDTNPGHFYVGSESFSVGQLGNDCLIHAVMKGTGRSDYIASDVRREIASACKDRKHPCYCYITGGIARNYVEIGLIRAGRPQWWPVLYPFLKTYGTEVQGLSGLEKCNRLNKEGTVGLREMKLDICHILSWNDIVNNIKHALETKEGHNVNRFLALMPSIDEVKAGTSIIGTGKGQKIFLKVFKDNSDYINGVLEVRRTAEGFCASGKMCDSERRTLEYYLHSAPGNLRLGDARTNRRIRKAMDYCSTEERSVNIKKKFEGCEYFTKPKKDEDGRIMTSYKVSRPPKKPKAVRKTIEKKK